MDAYVFVVVTFAVKGSTAKNPFTDVSVLDQFGPEGADPIVVEGFCEAVDGGTYCIR